ncbi:hypothetical protein GTO27_01320, partial [Candidatus Bathyarchaeota archaeon]|nr:hypothetical protein [Candidatus Bathyarchaeota archaeon]
MSLYDEFMLRTAHSEIYDELCEERKLFKLRAHLFTAALAYGILHNVCSQAKPNHDIVRLSQLEKRHPTQVALIKLLAKIVCKGEDERSRSYEILAYADGGLELLWEEYQAQGTLDVPRMVEEA